MTEIAHFLDSHGEVQSVPWPFGSVDTPFHQRLADHAQDTSGVVDHLRQLVREINADARPARPKGFPEYEPPDDSDASVSPVRLPPV